MAGLPPSLAIARRRSGTKCPIDVAINGLWSAPMASRGADNVSARLAGPVVRAVALFSLAGIVMLALVAAVPYAVSRRAGTDSAIRDALRDTDMLARTAIMPSLRDGLVNA